MRLDGQRGSFRDSGLCLLTCVAHAGMVYLDAHLVGLGGCDLDVLDGERLPGAPGNGGLTVSTSGKETGKSSILYR